MSGILDLSDVTLPAGPAYKTLFDFLRVGVPVTDGLVGLYQFGGAEALSLINHANAALPLTKFGAPTINAMGASCSQTACFETGLPETDAFTIIGVVKPAATTGMVVSNYIATTPFGSSLFQASGTTLNCGTTNGAGSNTGSSMATTVTTDWEIQMARVDATRAQAQRSRAGVVTASPDAAITGRTVVARNWRVGGHYATGSITGVREILAAAIYNRRLTDAELTSVYAALRSFFALGGVTTL